MTVLYTVALLSGLAATAAWAVAALLAAGPFRRTDPAERLGARGRRVVAAVLGFGMGGMSAAYAGWVTPLTLGAAVAGAAFLVAAGEILESGAQER